MRNHIFLLALALMAGTPVVAQPLGSALDPFFQSYLNERFAMHPTEATPLGDHRFDNKMDDLSPAAVKRALEHLRATRANLHKGFDRSKLSPTEQIDFEIFDHELETSIWLHENTKPFATNPRAYNEYISD